jgi:hypothetical protein
VQVIGVTERPLSTSSPYITRLRCAHALSAVAVWIGLFSGVIVLAYSYSYAARHPDSDRIHFHLFWLAEFLFLVPALLRLLDRRTSQAIRLTIILATAAFDYVPKYLRDPHFPLFHDELLHSREVAQIAATGRPFQPSPVVGIIQYFPGLHTVVVSLEKLTGASQFTLQSLLLLVLHGLALLGVFSIAEALIKSPRVAGLAAFAYSLNPSFLFFDTQFAYESLAIVLFIWTLAALARAETAISRQHRVGWIIVGAFLGCACAVTHHLSSYILAATLLFVSPVAIAGARRARAHWSLTFADGTLALVVAGAAVVWYLLVASSALAYLSPSFSGGLHQLAGLVSHEQQSRTLFAMSATPSYEHYASFLSPLIALLGVAAGAYVLLRGSIAPPALRGMVALAAVYFLSLPFIYTRAGSEGAHRSWGFSYLGVAILIAIATEELIAKNEGRKNAVMVFALAVVLAGILSVGNVAAGTDTFYRFPGPASTLSDIRTITPELRASAAWFARTRGPNRKIVSDRFTAPSLAYFADAYPATPSASFPTWKLYVSKAAPSPRLVSELQSSGYDYLFANGLIPLLAPYYQAGAVGRLPTSKVTTRVAIARFDRSQWAAKIYASDHLAFFRIDFQMLAAQRSAAQATRSLKR